MSNLDPKKLKKNEDIETDNPEILKESKIIIERKNKIKKKTLGINMDVLKCKLYNIKLKKKTSKSCEKPLKSSEKKVIKTPPRVEKTMRRNPTKPLKESQEPAQEHLQSSVQSLIKLPKSISNRTFHSLSNPQPKKSLTKTYIVDNSKVTVKANQRTFYKPKTSQEYKRGVFLRSQGFGMNGTMREIKRGRERRLWTYGIVGEKQKVLGRKE